MSLALEVSSDAPQRAAGRPRSEGCRVRILDATDMLLARDGFAKTSIDAIAQHAGVSKATIYRWWPNKAAVVIEAFLASTEIDFYVPATAFPEADLIAKIRRTVRLFAGPKGPIIASLIGEAQSDPEVAVAYREFLLVPRRAALKAAIERAIEGGIFRADMDIDLAIDMLYGPLYERLLLGHAPLDEAFERDYPPAAIAALRGYALPPRSSSAMGG